MNYEKIDNKNRMYISQTIAKIKYLLNEDVDVLGQLTGILRYYTEGVQRGKESSSYDKISKLFDLNTVKALNQKSLTIIRGTYDRSDQNKLIIDTFDIESLSKEFFNWSITLDFSVLLECSSRQWFPIPTSSRRFCTTSNAARFSATNSTVLF